MARFLQISVCIAATSLLEMLRYTHVLICSICRQYPDHLRTGPIILIVGERMGTSFEMMQSAVRQCNADNIKVGRARLRVPFGTHHSKISIFESKNGRVHIIISTANLLERDWDYKTQAFYHCSGSEVIRLLNN